MASYSDLLKDPRWQRRRLEILQRSDFHCESCNSGEKTLHVHHKIYRKGSKPWEYEDRELQALCEDCHAGEHKVRERLAESIAQLDLGDIDELSGYADGLRARAAVFGDKPKYESRIWPLVSYQHAKGFAISVRDKMSCEQVYEFIRMQPIGDLEVYCLQFDGLPTEFAQACFSAIKDGE